VTRRRTWLSVAAILPFLLAPSLPARAKEEPRLNVSIAVFDPGVPADTSLHRQYDIFPRIREIEARFMPFVLRETLAESGEWGAVRVVPTPDPAAELLLSGTIVESDGDRLSLAIRAVDAGGHVWLDREFSADPAREDMDASGGRTLIYEEIGRALSAVRDDMDAQRLDDVVEISLLRYAGNLAPSAFDGFLSLKEDGSVDVRRLPARDDPMLQRVERIRLAEFVITDTVDTEFRELADEIDAVYAIWREYRRKFVDYQAQNAERAATTLSDAKRGTYEDLRDQYDAYKWDRITVQEQDRLAIAFDNEVGPTVDAMEKRVAELTRWVDSKYAEWNRLLEALYDVETRPEAVAEPPPLPDPGGV